MSLTAEPIFQVAWIVDDIEAVEEQLDATLGVPRWTRIPDVHFAPEMCRYRGEPADFTVHVSLGWAGTQQLELIQPVRGRSLYADDLERHGPGVHHLGRTVEDIESAVEQATGKGMTVVQEGAFPGNSIRFAYLEAAAGGRTHLELFQISDGMRRFFDSLMTGTSGGGQ